MQRPHMRPQFRCELESSGSRLLQVIQARLEVPSSPVVGRVLRKHAELTVRHSRRQLWSPHLSLDLLSEGESVILRGRYGPDPALWTFVMAIYGVLIVASVGCGVFGLSQYMLGWTPWALCGFPCCLAIAGALWLTSLLGQRVCAGQMEELSAFLDECMQRAEAGPKPLPAPGAMAVEAT